MRYRPIRNKTNVSAYYGNKNLLNVQKANAKYLMLSTGMNMQVARHTFSEDFVQSEAAYLPAVSSLIICIVFLAFNLRKKCDFPMARSVRRKFSGIRVCNRVMIFTSLVRKKSKRKACHILLEKGHKFVTRDGATT